MKSLTWFNLVWRLTTTGTSVKITNDNRWNVVSITNESVVAVSDDLKSFELFQINASGWTMTVVKRWLDNSTTKTEVPGNKKERWPNTRFYITALASDFVANNTPNTWGAKQTFWDIDVTWTLTMKTASEIYVLWRSNPRPTAASEAARNIIYPTPIDGEVCKRTDLHGIEIYDASTAIWNFQSSGTPTPNASTSAWGIVKIWTALTDADQTAGLYNQTPNSVIKSYVDTAFINQVVPLSLRNYVLWENISSTWRVSLLPDGQIYKINNSIRTLNTGVTWQTKVKSCILPNNKIATLWFTGNTLTLWIWTLDLTTKTLTYGTPVTVTTNAHSSWYFTLCKAWVDELFIWYSDNTTHYSVKWRWVSISWTVPSIGNEILIVSWGSTWIVVCWGSCYVSNGNVAIEIFNSTWAGSTNVKVIVGSIAGNVYTLWSAAIVYNGGNNGDIIDIQYVIDNVIAVTYFDWTNSNICVYTVSWTTPTSWWWQWLWAWAGSNFIATDWTNIYTLNSGWTTLYKFTYSGNTLTASWTQSISASTWICCNGSLIWIVQSTSIVRYSSNGTLFSQKNTINYWISLALLNMNSQSNNYHLITVSWNPAPIYMIGNEERRFIWYLSSTGNLWDTKAIQYNNVVSWLTNIIIWEIYYINTNGTIWTSWVYQIGRWVSITEIELLPNMT